MITANLSPQAVFIASAPTSPAFAETTTAGPNGGQTVVTEPWVGQYGYDLEEPADGFDWFPGHA